MMSTLRGGGLREKGIVSPASSLGPSLCLGEGCVCCARGAWSRCGDAGTGDLHSRIIAIAINIINTWW